MDKAMILSMKKRNSFCIIIGKSCVIYYRCDKKSDLLKNMYFYSYLTMNHKLLFYLWKQRPIKGRMQQLNVKQIVYMERRQIE